MKNVIECISEAIVKHNIKKIQNSKEDIFNEKNYKDFEFNFSISIKISAILSSQKSDTIIEPYKQYMEDLQLEYTLEGYYESFLKMFTLYSNIKEKFVTFESDIKNMKSRITARCKKCNDPNKIIHYMCNNTSTGFLHFIYYFLRKNNYITKDIL